MPIYVYQGNKQISTNAIRNNKAVKAIYAKEQGKNTVCVWGSDDIAIFTYTVTNNKITITGLKQNKEPTSLIIPAQIEGITVTTIAPNAFKNKYKIKEVVIPDSVTSIGESAFRGCSNLTNMTLPFVGASKTARIYMKVFGYIFGYTKGNRYSPPSGTIYQYTYSSASYNEHYCYYIPSSIKSVIITGGNIPDNAFYNCSGLTSITIPDSVTSIGESAFNACTGLTSIRFPDNVTSIGENAFNACNNIQDIYTTDIVKWFEISPPLKSLMYYVYTNKNLYINNELAIDVTIPDGVPRIGSYAFTRCTKIRSITIPNSVTDFGYSVFTGCSGLTSIVFKGTKAQWNSISKGTMDWNSDTGNYTIHCTDGDIPKQ